MVQRTLTFDKGLRLFNRALTSNGTRIGVTSAEWHLEGNCQAPATIEFIGRRERFMIKYHVVQPRWNDPTTWESVSVIMHCKCRQCETCLKRRRIHWYHRAKFECSVAPRTWFGTLTFAPEIIVRYNILAERRAAKKGLVWQELSENDKFKALQSVCGEEITRFLKRVRKNSGAAVRYLLVSERHKSGLPHYHCLVHEASSVPIRHRVLSDAWPVGFTNFKLVQAVEYTEDGKPYSPAAYVAKYISKDVAARVRASEHYGDSSAFSVSLALPAAAQAAQGKRDVK